MTQADTQDIAAIQEFFNEYVQLGINYTHEIASDVAAGVRKFKAHAEQHAKKLGVEMPESIDWSLYGIEDGE